jgi:hypothetical protein
MTGAQAGVSDDAQRWWRANVDLLRLAAELGDDDAGARYERWLGRMRARAEAGNPYAREWLAELPE